MQYLNCPSEAERDWFYVAEGLNGQQHEIHAKYIDLKQKALEAERKYLKGMSLPKKQVCTGGTLSKKQTYIFNLPTTEVPMRSENDKQNNNSNKDGQSEAFNRQLPPSQTSTPMPKVKPPKQEEERWGYSEANKCVQATAFGGA